MRKEYLSRIETARDEQLEKTNSEKDLINTPNEWAAIAAHYLFDETRRGGYVPRREDYEENLIKAAAVILAALENIPNMTQLGYFQDEAKEETVSSFVEALARVTTLKK